MKKQKVKQFFEDEEIPSVTVTAFGMKIPSNDTLNPLTIYTSEFKKIPVMYNCHDELDYVYTLDTLVKQGFKLITGESYSIMSGKAKINLDKDYDSLNSKSYFSRLLVKNDKCLLSIETKYSKNATTSRKKKKEGMSILYIDSIKAYADNTEEMRNYVLNLFSDLTKYKIKFNEGNAINIIVSTENGLGATQMDLPNIVLDVEMNYGKEFMKVHETIIKSLENETNCGIILLHGLPGTGKTNYIKYLIANTDKTVLYIPPHLVNTLADPGFITFLMDYEDCILVIEDAENAIQSRNGEYSSPSVSNLLNMSDGILGSALKLKIIATFNSSKNDIDEALLRPGRLIAEHCFEKLSKENATKLFKHLGKDIEAITDMTLAEIYNYEDVKTETKSKNKKHIGFKFNDNE